MPFLGMRSLAALLLLSSVATASPALPAHYAALFEQGKTWVYDWSLVTFGAEDDKTGKPTHFTERGKVTCKVANVGKRAGATVSHVTCDHDELSRKFGVPGFYAATAAGVWRFADTTQPPTADDVREIVKQAPLIAGAPKVFEKTQKVDVLDPKHDTITLGVRASAKGHGWCAYEDTANVDPDGGHVVTCFSDGIGIESGYDDVGGSLNKFEYTAR